MQLAIYNKSLQAKSADKLDYWESVWRTLDNPFDATCPLNYNPEETVWRVELRFHHSIVQQFADGSCDAHTGAVIGKSVLRLSRHIRLTMSSAICQRFFLS